MSEVGNLRDVSVTLDGSGLATLAANANRQILIIFNGSAHDVQVNIAGGTAGVAGATAMVTLKASGASPPLQFDHWVPQNAITFKGTAADVICALEA